ncbi:MAG: lasso peptide biosynthesis B2 protein [Bryobacteraceae bacterium]
MTSPTVLRLPVFSRVPLWLALRAWFALVTVDVVLKLGGFPRLYRKVRNCPVADRKPVDEAVSLICTAVDRACTWYLKHALCLQRSAVATFLLRRAGVPAELVIAARRMPFQGHAWVEVDGHVVNDQSAVQETYLVLDRL